MRNILLKVSSFEGNWGSELIFPWGNAIVLNFRFGTFIDSILKLLITDFSTEVNW